MGNKRKVTATDPKEELRELTRQAHEAQRDLQRSLAEHRNFIRREVDEQIRREIAVRVDELAEQSKRAIKGAEERIQARFDRLTALLMGEDSEGPTLDAVSEAYHIAKLRKEGASVFLVSGEDTFEWGRPPE